MYDILRYLSIAVLSTVMQAGWGVQAHGLASLPAQPAEVEFEFESNGGLWYYSSDDELEVALDAEVATISNLSVKVPSLGIVGRAYVGDQKLMGKICAALGFGPYLLDSVRYYSSDLRSIELNDDLEYEDVVSHRRSLGRFVCYLSGQFEVRRFFYESVSQDGDQSSYRGIWYRNSDYNLLTKLLVGEQGSQISLGTVCAEFGSVVYHTGSYDEGTSYHAISMTASLDGEGELKSYHKDQRIYLERIDCQESVTNDRLTWQVEAAGSQFKLTDIRYHDSEKNLVTLVRAQGASICRAAGFAYFVVDSGRTVSEETRHIVADLDEDLNLLGLRDYSAPGWIELECR